MRSRVSAGRLVTVASACWIAVISALALPATAAVAAPDEAEIQEALERVRADPNLSPERTVRTLRWVDDGEEDRKKKEKSSSGWFDWVRGLFQWIAGVSRVLLWTAIVLLLGLLVLFITRAIRDARFARLPRLPDAPTHVRELDIRPESLPDDIGAAALALWERNEHRAALVLLYRGLLSRLVHAHAVPIRESSTEAECLQLAAPRLHTDAAEYAGRLVRVWQHAVYGAREPGNDEMHALCTRFDGNFPGLVARTAEQS